MNFEFRISNEELRIENEAGTGFFILHSQFEIRNSRGADDSLRVQIISDLFLSGLGRVKK